MPERSLGVHRVRVRPLSRRTIGRFIVFGAVVASGCLVDDSADSAPPGGPGGTGGAGGAASGAGGAAAGTSGTGGLSGSAGMSGAAGTGGMLAGAGSAGMAACMPNPVAQACAGFTAPAWGEPLGATSATMIDFATYMPDGTWGNSENAELTGGTYLYHGPDDVDLTATANATSLRLAGTITPLGYVGVVFWFDACVDASAFAGIAFSVGGSMGGAVMKAQIQTHADYPVDVASSRGGCSYTDCEDVFSECSGPVHQLVVPARPETIDLPWTAFSDGRPVNEVTPEGLVGLQFQLECQADTECTFQLTLANVSLQPGT
jgi:hypothetical protein